MNNRELKILYKEYQQIEELPDIFQKLINNAKEEAKKAYAPYSGFHVGASVLLSGETIVTASNQENSAYPSGLCAERVSCFYAKSKYPGKAIEAIAIAAWHKGEFLRDPVYPCGACRQVIAEYEMHDKSPIKVFLYGEHKIQVFESINDLLPFIFYQDNLMKRS